MLESKKMINKRELKEDFNERIIEWFMNNEELNKKLVQLLIEEKEDLNSRIDEDIYSDMSKELTENDLMAINYKREEINYIYELIRLCDSMVFLKKQEINKDMEVI